MTRCEVRPPSSLLVKRNLSVLYIKPVSFLKYRQMVVIKKLTLAIEALVPQPTKNELHRQLSRGL